MPKIPFLHKHDDTSTDDATQTESSLLLAASKEDKRASPTRRNVRYLWRGMIGFLLLLLSIALSTTWWLVNTESGLRFMLFDAPEKLALPVKIRSETLSGTLLRGFSGTHWHIETESSDIDVSDFVFQWQPTELWDKHLHITDLSAGNIHIQPKPVPPKPDDDQPTKLPESINLPLNITLERMRIGQISLGKEHTVLLRGAQFSYIYQDNKGHHANIVYLNTPWSESMGQIHASLQAPFALNGLIRSQGDLDGIAVQNTINLSGNLTEIIIKTDLSGNGVALQADTAVRPFAETLGQRIGHIKLNGEGISPHGFMEQLPYADLDFSANVLPDLDSPTLGLSGNIDLHNATPKPIDKQGIPVKTLHSNFTINESGAIELEEMTAELMKTGKIHLFGGIYAMKKTLNLQAEINNLTATDLLTQPLQGTLNGTIHTTGTFDAPQAAFKLDTGFAQTSGVIKLHTDKQLGQQTLLIENGEIMPPNGGKLALSGNLELFKQQKIQANIHSRAFNPHKLYPDLPEGNINGHIKLNGELASTAFHADMLFEPSVLSGAPLSGNGKISYQNNHLSRADTLLRLGNNELKTQGSFGKRGDKINLNIQAPNLQQFGFGLHGALSAKGTVSNTANNWTQIDAALEGQARNVLIPNTLKIQTLDFQMYGSSDVQRPLKISLNGKGISTGETVIDNIDTRLDGTVRQHHLTSSANLKIDGQPLKLNLAANGGLDAQNQWKGILNTIDINGIVNIRLQNALHLEAGQKRVTFGSARWQALGGSLYLERFIWDQASGLNTKGRADNLHFSELHHIYTPPIEHDLVIAGDWDLSYSHSPSGYLNLRQQNGDITLPTNRKPKLGLKNFVLRTELGGRGILSRFGGDVRYGKINGQFDILQAFGNGPFSQAPIRGSLKASVDDLNTLKNLLPVGQSVKGSLTGEAKITGTLNTPNIQGNINGENLHYRNRDVGVVLSNGTLKSHLQGQRWIIDALRFQQNKGSITLSGSADYAHNEPDISADIIFDHYQLLNQHNRHLTVSGKGQLSYNGTLFSLDGNLKTDEGRFGFQESSAPVLDNDVVVLGEENKNNTSSGTPLNLKLVFDLNDRFIFSGQGLDVKLGGKLTLSAAPNQDIRGIGSVHIVKGQYKAYGQDLIIKKGIISFVGPLDNPNLNIRAERRNSPVGAGVEVLGNLNTPRISLVANQTMSEKDKLSWLILNRASSGNSSDEATLATAASAWLAGSINDKIGLVDNFGLTSQQSRNVQTGEMNPAQQVLTFGKQLTQNLYLGYEAGLGDASQTVKLAYQISRSFQAILRIGNKSSGGEIKFQKRFDSLSTFFKHTFKKE